MAKTIHRHHLLVLTLVTVLASAGPVAAAPLGAVTLGREMGPSAAGSELNLEFKIGTDLLGNGGVLLFDLQGLQPADAGSVFTLSAGDANFAAAVAVLTNGVNDLYVRWRYMGENGGGGSTALGEQSAFYTSDPFVGPSGGGRARVTNKRPVSVRPLQRCEVPLPGCGSRTGSSARRARLAEIGA